MEANNGAGPSRPNTEFNSNRTQGEVVDRNTKLLVEVLKKDIQKWKIEDNERLRTLQNNVRQIRLGNGPRTELVGDINQNTLQNLVQTYLRFKVEVCKATISSDTSHDEIIKELKYFFEEAFIQMRDRIKHRESITIDRQGL